MGLGLEGDHALHLLHLEPVAGRLVFGGKLLHHRSLRKGHVVLIGRQNLIGVLLGGALDHREEARLLLLAVDDEGTTENLVAAMLRVNLGETKDFRVGQRTAVGLFYLVQILHFIGREGESFLLVVFLQILHALDGLGLDVNGKDALVEPFIHTLEHGVMVGILAGYGEILLNTGNAAETHVLGNLHGIGAPGSNHLPTGTHKESLHPLAFHELGITIEPAEFLGFFLTQLMVYFSCDHAVLRSLEK